MDAHTDGHKADKKWSQKLILSIAQMSWKYEIIIPTTIRQADNYVNELEICQYDTDAPTQGPSSPRKQAFCKNKSWKRAITLIIIDGYYPKANSTYTLWLYTGVLTNLF